MEYCDRRSGGGFSGSSWMGGGDRSCAVACDIHWHAGFPVDSSPLLGTIDEIQRRLRKDRLSNAFRREDTDAGYSLDSLFFNTIVRVLCASMRTSRAGNIRSCLLCDRGDNGSRFHRSRYQNVEKSDDRQRIQSFSHLTPLSLCALRCYDCEYNHLTFALI